MGLQVAQSVERRTLEVEVRGSKPALGPCGGVGAHLTSHIQWDAMTLETDTDNCQVLNHQTLKIKIKEFPKKFAYIRPTRSKLAKVPSNRDAPIVLEKPQDKKTTTTKNTQKKNNQSRNTLLRSNLRIETSKKTITYILKPQG